MQLDYDEFINLLNKHEISEVKFSVVDYPHYRDCRISVIKETYCNVEFYEIEVALTKDSEKFFFNKEFEEDRKLFDMKRKGTFTLKQMWNRIQINSIKMS